MSPSVLLLDEPAGGFSDVRRRELAQAIAPLAREHGMGLLVVDHDMPFVMSMCDRIVVLNFGQKIADGTRAGGPFRPDRDRCLPARPQHRPRQGGCRDRRCRAQPAARAATPQQDEVLLAARDMAVGYYETPVVRGIELEVRPGEITALLGANRAGKTTTLLGLGRRRSAARG